MRLGVGIYVKNSAEAVALYQEAFGLELGYHVKNPDGSFYHSELYRDGIEVLDVIESPLSCPLIDNIVQINVIMDSEEEAGRAFELISAGGQVEMPLKALPWSPCAAIVTDKFGVWWYISAPQHYPDDSFEPSSQSGQR